MSKVINSNVVSISVSSKAEDSQIKAVIGVTGKYHDNQFPSQAFETLEISYNRGMKLANDAGIKVIKNNRNETFYYNNDELDELVTLTQAHDNPYARKMILFLCKPQLMKYYNRHTMLDTTLNMNDNYWDVMALGICVLDEVIDYYYSLKNKGSLVAKDGYKQATGFGFFLRLRLNEIGRTIADENKIFSFGDGSYVNDPNKKNKRSGDGVIRNINKIKKFMEQYEALNGEQKPSEEEISKVIGVTNPTILNRYMNVINTSFIPGNEPVNSGKDSGSFVETNYDMIADENSCYENTKDFGCFAVRQAVSRLDNIKSNIIRLKYGIECDGPHTDAEVISILKITEDEYKDNLASAIKMLSVSLSDFQCGLA